MKINELKDMIENKTLTEFPLILECQSNDYFLANMYIDHIAALRGVEVEHCRTLPTFANNTKLFVYTCDDFNTMPTINNIVIRCNKCSCQQAYQYVVSMPELEHWQIDDFASYNIPGVKPEDREWMCAICKYNITAIANEVNKIKMFEQIEQQLLFDNLRDTKNYDIYSTMSSYEPALASALLKRDKETVLRIISYNNNINALGVINMLISSFSIVLTLQENPKLDSRALGINDRQYNSIKENNLNVYSTEKLKEILTMLRDAQYNLQTGLIKQDELIYFVICGIL